MKKIIALLFMLLAGFGFASQATAAAAPSPRTTNGGNMAEQIDLSEFDFPEGTSEEAIHNTEILYIAMQTLSENQLDKANFFFAADILAEDGIVISNIHIQEALENNYVYIIITDKNGCKYDVVMCITGGLSLIQREDGKTIYFAVDGEEPPVKCWQKLPAWLQWILRYVCFGWIWMK